MITLSDNTATNLLIDLLGIDYINETIQNFNLKDTKLKRKMMDFAAIRAGRDNTTSVIDMGRLLEKIYQGNGLGISRQAAKEVFNILTKQILRDCLSRQPRTSLRYVWQEKI